MRVLMMEGELSGQMAQQLKDQLALAVPDHKVIVLGNGLKLGVLSPLATITNGYAQGGFVAPAEAVRAGVV